MTLVDKDIMNLKILCLVLLFYKANATFGSGWDADSTFMSRSDEDTETPLPTYRDERYAFPYHPLAKVIPLKDTIDVLKEVPIFRNVPYIETVPFLEHMSVVKGSIFKRLDHIDVVKEIPTVNHAPFLDHVSVIERVPITVLDPSYNNFHHDTSLHSPPISSVPLVQKDSYQALNQNIEIEEPKYPDVQVELSKDSDIQESDLPIDKTVVVEEDEKQTVAKNEIQGSDLLTAEPKSLIEHVVDFTKTDSQSDKLLNEGNILLSSVPEKETETIVLDNPKISAIPETIQHTVYSSNPLSDYQYTTSDITSYNSKNCGQGWIPITKDGRRLCHDCDSSYPLDYGHDVISQVDHGDSGEIDDLQQHYLPYNKILDSYHGSGNYGTDLYKVQTHNTLPKHYDTLEIGGRSILSQGVKLLEDGDDDNYSVSHKTRIVHDDDDSDTIIEDHDAHDEHENGHVLEKHEHDHLIEHHEKGDLHEDGHVIQSHEKDHLHHDHEDHTIQHHEKVHLHDDHEDNHEDDHITHLREKGHLHHNHEDDHIIQHHEKDGLHHDHRDHHIIQHHEKHGLHHDHRDHHIIQDHENDRLHHDHGDHHSVHHHGENDRLHHDHTDGHIIERHEDEHIGDRHVDHHAIEKHQGEHLTQGHEDDHITEKHPDKHLSYEQHDQVNHDHHVDHHNLKHHKLDLVHEHKITNTKHHENSGYGKIEINHATGGKGHEYHHNPEVKKHDHHSSHTDQKHQQDNYEHREPHSDEHPNTDKAHPYNVNEKQSHLNSPAIHQERYPQPVPNDRSYDPNIKKPSYEEQRTIHDSYDNQHGEGYEQQDTHKRGYETGNQEYNIKTRENLDSAQRKGYSSDADNKNKKQYENQRKGGIEFIYFRKYHGKVRPDSAKYNSRQQTDGEKLYGAKTDSSRRHNQSPPKHVAPSFEAGLYGARPRIDDRVKYDGNGKRPIIPSNRGNSDLNYNRDEKINRAVYSVKRNEPSSQRIRHSSRQQPRQYNTENTSKQYNQQSGRNYGSSGATLKGGLESNYFRKFHQKLGAHIYGGEYPTPRVSNDQSNTYTRTQQKSNSQEGSQSYKTPSSLPTRSSIRRRPSYGSYSQTSSPVQGYKSPRRPTHSSLSSHYDGTLSAGDYKENIPRNSHFQSSNVPRHRGIEEKKYSNTGVNHGEQKRYFRKYFGLGTPIYGGHMSLGRSRSSGRLHTSTNYPRHIPSGNYGKVHHNQEPIIQQKIQEDNTHDSTPEKKLVYENPYETSYHNTRKSSQRTSQKPEHKTYEPESPILQQKYEDDLDSVEYSNRNKASLKGGLTSNYFRKFHQGLGMPIHGGNYHSASSIKITVSEEKPSA